MDSTSGSAYSTDDSKPEEALKTVSLPMSPVTDKAEVKVQISAPSYLRSLAENDLPPFKPPSREPKPILLMGINPIMSSEEAIDLVAVMDTDPANGLKTYFSLFLVQKKIINCYDLMERNFLLSFLNETVTYAAQHDFCAIKLALLITIYLSLHIFFKTYYWKTPISIWAYFKELMIRHTIDDTPDAQYFFKPQESYDILTHFHTMYMRNLPLIHICTFGSHRLKLIWPFKPK